MQLISNSQLFLLLLNQWICGPTTCVSIQPKPLMSKTKLLNPFFPFLSFSFFAMKLPWSSNMDGHWCQLRSATSGELISIDRRIPRWFHSILWLISITWLSSRLALHLLSLQVSHVYKTQSSQESICCIDHPFCSSCHHQWSSSHGTVLSLQICWLCKSSHVITCLFLSCFRCTLHVYWFSITERVSQCMLSRLARNYLWGTCCFFADLERPQREGRENTLHVEISSCLTNSWWTITRLGKRPLDLHAR